MAPVHHHAAEAKDFSGIRAGRIVPSGLSVREGGDVQSHAA